MSLIISGSTSIYLGGVNRLDASSFTVMGWAYVITDLGAISQPVFIATDTFGTDADVFFDWKDTNAGSNMSIGSYNPGDGANTTQFGSRPATATWFHWYVKCSGTGAAALEAGWRTTGAYVTATSTLKTNSTGILDFRLSNDGLGNTANMRHMAFKLFPTALSATDIQVESLTSYTNRRATMAVPLNGATIFQSLKDYSGRNVPLIRTGAVVLGPDPPTVISRGSVARKNIVAGPRRIQFDATSNSGYQSSSGFSFSHTCSGNNRYLIVGISMLSVAGASVSSITYAGNAMTLLGTAVSVSGTVRTELWGQIAPNTGGNSIAVTLSTSVAWVGGGISLTNVHQTSPTEGFASATATNVGAADAAVDVTTAADYDWVIDTVATDDTAITVGAGQTSRWNVTGALGSGAGSHEGFKSPAGAVTMSWSAVGALATWTIGAIAIRPVTAASLTGRTTRNNHPFTLGVNLGIGIGLPGGAVS